MSDMVLSASLSQPFEVGTIIIPTSMMSKTKPPQCLVIHYYSMWCLCLAGWEMRKMMREQTESKMILFFDLPPYIF